MNLILVVLAFASIVLFADAFILPTRGLFLKPRTSSTARNFKNFDEMMEQLDVPVLVDFFAPWCGPCVMMAPILEDLAGRMENEIKVAKVDTDKNPRLGSRYQVEALPTLILFNKGEILERFVGYRSADELEREVKKALQRIANQKS